MNVDENRSAKQNWNASSLSRAKRELEDAMLVTLIPDQFHHGIRRVLLFLAEYPAGIIMDETADLFEVFEEIMNYPDLDQYDDSGVNGCLGLGSEFGVFSLQRDFESGLIHLAEIRQNAVAFCMSVCMDFELGAKISSILEEENVFESKNLLSQWSSVTRAMLTAAISDNDVPLSSEIVMSRFADALSIDSDKDMVAYFGADDGFSKALQCMTDLGILKQNSGKISVEASPASVFLTRVDDAVLLEKLKLST